MSYPTFVLQVLIPKLALEVALLALDDATSHQLLDRW